MQSSQALSLQKANLTGTSRKPTTQTCCVKPAGALHNQWKVLIVPRSDIGSLCLKEGKVSRCLGKPLFSFSGSIYIWDPVMSRGPTF